MKKRYNQFTMMVTDDYFMKALYTHSLSDRCYGQVAGSCDVAALFCRINQPYIMFIDQGISDGKSEALVMDISRDHPSILLVYLADKMEGELPFRLWGKVKELIRKPVRGHQILNIYEKYCHFTEKAIAPWRVATEMIIQRYGEPGLTEKLICKELGLNAAYFSRLYHSMTGQPFQKTLLETRIYHARQLLMKKDLRVSQVANMVGYKRVGSFIRSFHQLTGESPLSYRQRMTMTYSRMVEPS